MHRSLLPRRTAAGWYISVCVSTASCL
jgi:hypothetical protein